MSWCVCVYLKGQDHGGVGYRGPEESQPAVSLCVCAYLCDGLYQQLKWVCVSGDSCVQVLAYGQTGIQGELLGRL